jgi:hypothetical protein
MKKANITFLFLLLIILVMALAGCNSAYKLSFSQEEYTVISGIEFVPDITIKPKDMEYELSSSNITIAKVQDKTTIVTLREGIVTITAISGDLETSATLTISDDIDYDVDDIIFAETVSISFVITNYELAGLTTEDYGITQTAIKGGYASFIDDPYIKGYIVYHWFTDRECTILFNENTDTIESDMVLYAYLEEREISYDVTDGFIVGLTYDNLDHDVLDLPETTENGTEIVGIADDAFTNDLLITEVNMPCTYKTIGNNAFAGCENLVNINFIGGESQMEVIGINAFGAIFDDDGDIESACTNLVKFDLADTVYEIGAYAFYYCSSLSFDGIPTKVNILPQYCFAYTKINNVDLSSVKQILQSAFEGCSYLDTVTNSENVTHCYQYAFKDTKLYEDSVEDYLNESSIDETKAVVYADTIAVGIYSKFGYALGTGSGNIVLKDSCTLIGDKAFYGEYLSEITLYVTTDIAAEVLESGDYGFIGCDVMNIGYGTHIVVPKSSVATYKLDYEDESGEKGYEDYDSIFCYEDTIVIESGTNVGTHNIFVFEDDDGIESYEYHKYTGTATLIKLNLLGYGGTNFTRISSFAFSSNATITQIYLGNVDRIAILAVTKSCTSLTSIYLTSCSTPPEIESTQSFQLPDADYDSRSVSIYINSGDYDNYVTAWYGNTTMINALVKVS